MRTIRIALIAVVILLCGVVVIAQNIYIQPQPARSLLFGGTVLNNSNTPPSPGQCLSYDGTVITGADRCGPTPTPTGTPGPTPTSGPQNFDYFFGDYGGLDLNRNYSCYFNERAGTAVGAVLTIGHFQCTGATKTVVIQDCGAVPGVCSSPTIIATHNPTATGIFVVPLSSTALVQGDYICAAATAGSCTDLDWNWTLHGDLSGPLMTPLPTGTPGPTGTPTETPTPTNSPTPTPQPTTYTLLGANVNSDGQVTSPVERSPLIPSLGGVGTMTGGPMWARYFGTGAEGGGPASGAIAIGMHNYSSWTCTGAITATANGAIFVRSQGTVALNTGCTITSSNNNSTTVIDMGGAGGSGGSGAANSSASTAALFYSANYTVSAAAAASSASAGNAGGVISATATVPNIRSLGPTVKPVGGGPGTRGGSTGGVAGNGGTFILIIAPTITVANGVVIDSTGGPGAQATGNSTGGGGGGGGGMIWLISEVFTDAGGIYKYGGGPGGAITQPSIQALGDGCNTSGCGTGAFFTVTGLTTGGLDAAKITIANGGSGYNVAPTCKVNAGTSGLIGSPACHFTISGGAIASVVIDTPGSGGALTTYTTAFVGGYGANGVYWQSLMQ